MIYYLIVIDLKEYESKYLLIAGWDSWQLTDLGFYKYCELFSYTIRHDTIDPCRFDLVTAGAQGSVPGILTPQRLTFTGMPLSIPVPFLHAHHQLTIARTEAD